MPEGDSSRLVSVARRDSPGARCAFCHDSLGELSTECRACRTVLHAECRAQILECPTLGCRQSVFSLRDDGSVRPSARLRPGFRRALADLAALHDTGTLNVLPDVEVPELARVLAERRAAAARTSRTPVPSRAETFPAAAPLDEPTGTGVEARARARRAIVRGRGSETPEPLRRPIWRTAAALLRVGLLPLTAPLLALLFAVVVVPVRWLEIASGGRWSFPRVPRAVAGIAGALDVEWLVAPLLAVGAAILAGALHGLSTGIWRELLLVPFVAVVVFWPAVSAWYRAGVRDGR